MPKIPQYFFKVVEEIARGVGVAVVTYLAAAVVEEGIPTTTDALVALAVGAIPIAYAALRAALNSTPLTPDA